MDVFFLWFTIGSMHGRFTCIYHTFMGAFGFDVVVVKCRTWVSFVDTLPEIHGKSLWKILLGRWSFLFGARAIFLGYVSFRQCNPNNALNGKLLSIINLQFSLSDPPKGNSMINSPLLETLYMHLARVVPRSPLGGGFKYFLFSPLFGENVRFD